MSRLLFSTVLLLLSFTGLRAQDQLTLLPEKLYKRSLAGSQQLFNGTEYKKHRSHSGEHPFFLSDQYIVGRLKYDGVDYEAVPLYFDIAKDVLVTPYYFDGTWMAFVSELVSEFEVKSRVFRYVRENINGLPGPGFYEILFTGSNNLWLRHNKVYEERIDGMEITHQFKYNYEYYLVRGNEAFRLNENEKLPLVLKDKRAELRVFLRKNPYAGLIDVVRFYDGLK